VLEYVLTKSDDIQCQLNAVDVFEFFNNIIYFEIFLYKQELPLFIFFFRENWPRLIILSISVKVPYMEAKSFTNVNRVRM
jgi:hypothetical protein